MLLIRRSLNYTQFKCLNGIADPSCLLWQCNRHLHDASKLRNLFGLCIGQFYIDPWFFTLCGIKFYKFAGKDLELLNIKSFKSKQYSLQTKIFGFHGYLIVKILNIFCIIPYARMIMALIEQVIGFTGPYTVITIVLCNDLLEKNNLSQRICMCSCTSRFSSRFPPPIRWFILLFRILKRSKTY